MGKVTLTIDDEIERQVRIRIAERGGKRGELKKVIEDALGMWLDARPAPRNKEAKVG